MKKYLFSFITVLATTISVVAQSTTAGITTVPAIITDPSQPVTVYVDLTALPGDKQRDFASYADTLWMWTWSPVGIPECVSSKWPADSPTKLQFTRVGANIYKYKFNPSVTGFYNTDEKSAFESGIKFLLRNINGSKQTGDLFVKITAPIVEEKATMSFPNKVIGTDSLFVIPDDIVTLRYNNDVDTLSTMKGVGADDVYAQMRVVIGGQTFNYATIANIDVTNNLKMEYLGGKRYQLQFIPSKFFLDPACSASAAIQAKLATGAKIERIRWNVLRKRANPGTSVGANPYVLGPPEYFFLIPKY